MLSRKEEWERKKLLTKGKVSLNKLTCSFDDEKLQNLLYYYNLCKKDISKLKQAIKVLNHIGSFIHYSDVQKMKEISKD